MKLEDHSSDAGLDATPMQAFNLPNGDAGGEVAQDDGLAPMAIGEQDMVRTHAEPVLSGAR